MPIHVLPTHLVNKIAAGEVIERPASIVKELVENSLDAGATRIDVAVEDGGRKLISVSDDGCGMDAQDLALAFVPHATSKIGSEDDLFSIHTMGFRGEALASIASVSHAHIRSAPRASGQSAGTGCEIEASDQTLGSVRPCPSSPGTTITIRDLFFNTPARRKFLKTVNTELGHISEQVARMALPHPQVAFSLTHNSRSIQKLPAAGSTLQRACDLFGAELAQSLITIPARRGRVQVAGLICQPSAARASAQWQYFFINGRYVRDRLLAHALREAYRGQVDPSRWPMAFIFITIDPAEVDVNVHPTKIEVRFRDSQAIHGELLAALRDTLNRSNLAPTVSLAESLSSEPPAASALADIATPPLADTQRQASVRQALVDFFKSAPHPQPRLGFPESAPATRFGTDRQPLNRVPEDRKGSIPPVSSLPAIQSDPTEAATQVSPGSESNAVPLGFRAIQIHSTYIVASSEDGLIIVDQHALHERLIYNDLKRRLEQGPLAGQRMLLPATLSVTAAGAAALANRGDLLARLGIEVSSFGQSALAVQQFPSLLTQRGVAPTEFLAEMIDKLLEDDTADEERLLEDLLQMLACKAAVKAGDPLTGEEIESLLAHREDAEKGGSCPHGRPTTLKMTLKDLEKQFKRI